MQKFRLLRPFCLSFLLALLASCSFTPIVPSNGLGDPYDPADPPPYHHAESIWKAMANNFSLMDENTANPTVREQINWYMSHPSCLKDMSEQSRPYLFYILQQVKNRHLPAELALLPMLESSYDPFAYSHMGAAGLWQMMPGTASGFGLKVDWWYDGRRDIVASTKSALDYLAYLGDYFNQNWLLAIAAYDAGEGAVVNAMHANVKKGESTDFWYLPLPQETQSYVPKLLALATIIQHPSEYPMDWPEVPNRPYLTMVDVGSQIDLEKAADMAGITLRQLSSLNPGYNRWATDPDGPHQLLLPIDKAAHFQEELNKMPKEQRVTWIRYNVEAGDSLSVIAKKMKTTVPLLKQVNHLNTDRLKLNQTLLIPTETGKLTKVVLHFEKRYFKTLNNRIPEIKLTNHIVQKGDSLQKIAAHYHVSVNDIRFWNGLKERSTLKPGKSLVLWPSTHRSSSSHKRLAHSHIRPGKDSKDMAKTYALHHALHLPNGVWPFIK